MVKCQECQSPEAWQGQKALRGGRSVPCKPQTFGHLCVSNSSLWGAHNLGVKRTCLPFVSRLGGGGGADTLLQCQVVVTRRTPSEKRLPCSPSPPDRTPKALEALTGSWRRHPCGAGLSRQAEQGAGRCG